MKSLVQIIPLRSVAYSDNRAILTTYSRQRGRMSFIIAIGGGREAARRRSILQPLSIAECIATIMPNREICHMSEPRALLPLHGLRTNPVKTAIAAFVAELLSNVLRESQPDEALFDYIAGSIATLDALPTARLANFHICFIYGLGRALGIEPDISTYRPGAVFDLNDGVFRLTPPLHANILPPDESRELTHLARMTFDNMHRFSLNRNRRIEIINRMLAYISFHHTSLAEIRSLDVLHTIFS